MDFVGNYTGNVVADVIFSAFEKIGMSVVSRKVMDAYKEKEYKMVYAHSAGGYVYLNHKDNIRAKNVTLIGAEGTYLGRYKELDSRTTTKIAFKGDIVPHVAPAENGRVGIEYAFGEANTKVLEMDAPENPKSWDFAGHHESAKYIAMDMPRLIKIMSESYIPESGPESEQARQRMGRVSLDELLSGKKLYNRGR